MIQQQQTMILSPYIKLYDLIVPKDNILRKTIRMFKYLLLKVIYDLSDVDIVERSKYDMSFKYFLDMAPEEGVIDPSLLTKFRKLRLKNIKLLELLISKTVNIAIEKGIIESKSIIVDSTHTKARYNQKTPREILLDYSKKLRQSVYKIDESLKSTFPTKVNNGVLEDEIEYCQKLINVIKENTVISSYPDINEKLNMLEEIVNDDIEKLILSNDEDAKVGHKTYDTSFFGYKTHIAMTEERIITAATHCNFQIEYVD